MSHGRICHLKLPKQRGKGLGPSWMWWRAAGCTFPSIWCPCYNTAMPVASGLGALPWYFLPCLLSFSKKSSAVSHVLHLQVFFFFLIYLFLHRLCFFCRFFREQGAEDLWGCMAMLCGAGDGSALHTRQDPTKNKSLGLIHRCWCGWRVSCRP